jgi:Domain of unknown function (DUF5916)
MLCPGRGTAQSRDDVLSLQASALAGSVRLDGVLDEPEWSAADAIPDLTMIEPLEGDAPTGRTSVRVLATDEALYIGIVCEDPEPEGIVSFTKQRDGNLRSEDNVRIVLDTFLDGRSGYVFQINPNGARYDALISPGGDAENSNWDGVWDAATHRDSGGWSAEIWIPIQTLSFKPGLSEWNFNVERHVQRLQETDRWASPRRDWKLTQTSRAGRLANLPEFSLGRGLSVRPAVTGGGGIDAPGKSVRATGDVSLDVTQRLGPNLLSSLSVNTDFAESEVDTRRTNLTRFPLFFPETRTFFLEGSDIFQFGPSLGSDVVPFFSRRIGLVSGQEVPILAGAKVNGRVGATNGGAVVVRTREVDALAPAATMAAMRVKRNVWGESSIGFIATAGDPLGRANSWLIGPDFSFETSRFRGNKNFRVGLWGLLMGRDGAPGNKSAMGVRVAYPNDLWNIFATAMRLGDGFDPSLGFVPRPGVYSYRFVVTNTPKSSGWLRQMEHEVQYSMVTDLQGKLESYRIMIVPLNWRFDSGDRVEINLVPQGERLAEPFEVADGVALPIGAYDWWRYRVEVGSAVKRTVSAQVTWWLGGFYDGTLNQFQWTGTWHPSALVTLDVSGERNIGKLDEGRFSQTVVGTRMRVDVSPDLQISSYWQYDSDSKSVGTNSKLRWTFRPLGDFFVIYNHNIRRIDDRWRLDSNQLLVKLQYAFRY